MAPERDEDYEVIHRWMAGDAEPFFGTDRTGPTRFDLPLPPRSWRERLADWIEYVARAIRGR